MPTAHATLGFYKVFVEDALNAAPAAPSYEIAKESHA